MKKILLITFAILLLCQVAISEEPTNLPPEILAVKKYVLENDYPELFKDIYYRTRAENLLISDIDNDGSNEVVAHFSPHYRQSAPIIFFKITKSLKVNRVIEGLAPGPLVPLTGDYLDSHTLGEAVDFDISDKQAEATARDDVIKVSLSHFGGVVAYRNFFHADSRKGSGYYINMLHISNPPTDKTCENFEFSKVKQIAAGNLKSNKKKNYLAAWVEDDIYIYLIQEITDEGFLKKQLWVNKAPKEFQGFIPDNGLTYLLPNGEIKQYDINL